MVELKPDATTPQVHVCLNIVYSTPAGLARLIRALTISQKWLDKEKGATK